MLAQTKKYQIFISSTYTDLIAERDEVMKAILTHYHIPIGMEMFSADDDEQWITIKETIDASDYYVLIIGHRYGSLSHEGFSYTEKEFRYAQEQKIPTYVFIRDRDVPTTPAQRDDDPGKARLLEAFIESAKTGRMTDFWKNKDELALKVMSALNKAFARTQRVGWVRADQVIDSSTILEQMSELSKKYIEILEENESLKINAAAFFRAPQFDFVFNDGHPLVIEIDDSRYPANLFLSDDEDYNKEALHFLRRYTYAPLMFNITNTGTRAASEVYIDFEFPQNIGIKHPKEVLREFHLAGRKYTAKDAMLPQRTYGYLNSLSRIISIEQPSRVEIQNVYNVNRLTFYLAELPHKRTFYFRESFLSGLESLEETTFNIKITCDEKGESQILEVPVSIVITKPGYQRAHK